MNLNYGSKNYSNLLIERPKSQLFMRTVRREQIEEDEEWNILSPMQLSQWLNHPVVEVLRLDEKFTYNWS